MNDQAMSEDFYDPNHVYSIDEKIKLLKEYIEEYRECIFPCFENLESYYEFVYSNDGWLEKLIIKKEINFG
jgi:uncharacterized protein YutD